MEKVAMSGPPRGQRRRAVALVDVQVDDEHARRMPLLHQPHGGDRQIVEHAIARARVVQRVVAPARAVGGEPPRLGRQRGLEGAARHQLRAPRDGGRDRKADPPLLGRRHPRAHHLFHIARAVDGTQPVERHRLGLDPLQRRAAASSASRISAFLLAFGFCPGAGGRM
jgi:hypothetical protein